MEYLSTDKLQETWNERKNKILSISLGSSGCDWHRPGWWHWVFSFLLELSHQSRAEANPTVGTSPGGVPMPGKLGFGVIFWENPAGMKRRCVWMGKGDLGWQSSPQAGNTGMELWHTQTQEWAQAQPHPQSWELHIPHQAAGIQLHSHLITPSDDISGYEVKSSSLGHCSHCSICCSIKFSCVFFAGCHRILCPIPRNINISLPKPVFPGRIHTGSIFSRNPQFFMAWLPKENNTAANSRKEWSCFRYLDPKLCSCTTVRQWLLLMIPCSHICALPDHPSCRDHFHDPGSSWSEMPHRNDIIPSLSTLVTWTHSFPMLTLANSSSSSTATYKLTRVICALTSKGWERNCLGIALTLEQDPFLSVSKSSQEKSVF